MKRSWQKIKYKFKSCPFCGGAKLYHGHESWCRFHVQCLDCRGSGGAVSVEFVSVSCFRVAKTRDKWSESETEIDRYCMDKAVEKWNERTN